MKKKKKRSGFGINDHVQGINEPTNPRIVQPPPPLQLPNPFQIFQEAQKPKMSMEADSSFGCNVVGPNDDPTGLGVYQPHTRIVERNPERFSPPTQAPPKKKKKKKAKR